MVKKEVVSSRRILSELQSERFQSGLARAVEMTYETGRETKFEIEKEFGGNHWLYPETIIIGENMSVGTIKTYDNKFDEEFGKRKNADEFSDIGKWVKYMHEREDIKKKWFDKKKIGNNGKVWEPYPFEGNEGSVWSFSSFQNTWYHNHKIQDIFPDKSYLAIHFHTHPGGHALPSLGDLVNCYNRSIVNINDETKSVNPIHVITGINTKNVIDGIEDSKNKMILKKQNINLYKSFIYQRNDDVDSNLEDIERSHNAIVDYYNDTATQLGLIYCSGSIKKEFEPFRMFWADLDLENKKFDINKGDGFNLEVRSG